MGCLNVLIAFIIFFGGAILLIDYPVPTISIAGILTVIGLIYYRKHSQEQLEKEIQRKAIEQDSLERAKQEYNLSKSRITIPDNALKVTYNNGDAELLKLTENYIWLEGNNLCFFPVTPTESDLLYNIEKIRLYKIPMDKIENFTIRGEVIQENRISGGGGGGSNLGGAVVGGVIAGGAGAVIGSRGKIDTIKSELITHDKRETVLNYLGDKNAKQSMFFDFNDHNIFNELMPEKEFEIVKTIKTNRILKEFADKKESLNIPDQIRELAKLKDEGLITEEEFMEKKKSLLNMIG